jgi:uncharacterized membrane protein
MNRYREVWVRNILDREARMVDMQIMTSLHNGTAFFASTSRHFNRGQRAFFFALGYLCWFVSPWVLLATTALVVIVTWRRQFASNAWRAMGN